MLSQIIKRSFANKLKVPFTHNTQRIHTTAQTNSVQVHSNNVDMFTINDDGDANQKPSSAHIVV